MSRSTRPQKKLSREVRYLKGVGPKRAEKLARLDIHTIRDLLLHLPRDYEDRRTVTDIAVVQVGQKHVVEGTIIDSDFRRTRGRRGLLRVSMDDGTGLMELVWFNATRGWEKNFPSGSSIVAFGEIQVYNGLQIVQPDYELNTTAEASKKFGDILPIYPLTEGISQGLMRKLVRAALEEASDQLPEILPPGVRRQKDILPFPAALAQAHFPQSWKQKKAARRSLNYGELFLLQTALALRRQTMREEDGISFKVGPNVDRHIRGLFPFGFTSAQDRVIRKVRCDMRSDTPMYRLLQGDVGCGKTVVAVYAMLAALAETSKGYQTALMAPTAILAEQHYLTLQSLLEKAQVRTQLLTNQADRREREQNLERIARGEIDLVVGTHALIQEDVRFRNLGLVVVDEQHRFGVRQRLSLSRKGTTPDVLIMTATPIPRTLALTCFADMELSIIDEMPPGRKEVHTGVYPPTRWDDAFAAAVKELQKGYRVFVIYPLVEENEELDLTSATEGFEELSSGVFAEYDCCLLHGQMPSEKKRKAMEGFRDGEYQVMIATTVVEVGIDVPEATVMIIQHAERLGLAQLHQLRGRIGRGEREGKCYLLAEPATEEAHQRLDVLARTSDGFKIAEEDLRIRGPGQFFGTEQSGMPEFRIYDFSDPEVLKEARDDAVKLVEQDPDLSRQEHRTLRKIVLAKYGKRFVLGGVG